MIAIPKLDEKREKLLWEIGFLAVYAVLLTQYFINTTVIHLEIPYLIPKIPSYRMWIRLFAITFVVLKTARDEKFSWKELIFAAIMLISFGRCAQVAGYMELVDLAVLIIGARNVSYKKILGLYCGVSGALIVGTMGLCFAGVIEDWVFEREVNGSILGKHSYGFMYPNEFGAHVFFWLLGYSALRREKITYVELAGYVLTAIGLWKFCYAKTNVICIGLMVVGIIFCKIVAKLDQEKHEKWLKAVRVVLALFPIAICIGMLVMTVCYSGTNELLVKLDSAVFNTRLRFGKAGFDKYGVKLFGQYVEMVGASLPGTWQRFYNFLDCSYVSILIRFGLASFFVIILSYAKLIFDMLNKKKLLILGLIALVSVQCAMEHHLHEIAYNPLMILVLAKIEGFSLNGKLR